MPVEKLILEPTDEFPVPFDIEEEQAPSHLERLAVAGNTAELQKLLGAPMEMDADSVHKYKNLLKDVVQGAKTTPLRNPVVAIAAADFLRIYGQQLAIDAASARNAITNKLFEIANCGETRFELRALELLGKHSDIGLFTERSEITIKYKDPSELETAITDRVKRLLNATVVDVTPLGIDLDDEFSAFGAHTAPKKELVEKETEDAVFEEWNKGPVDANDANDAEDED